MRAVVKSKSAKEYYFGMYGNKAEASAGKARARNAYPEAEKLTIVRKAGYSVKVKLPSKAKKKR